MTKQRTNWTARRNQWAEARAAGARLADQIMLDLSAKRGAASKPKTA